ncbi:MULTISPECIES: methionine ABC transporter permease [Microvirga]|jgi:D-methionine transport system permease protein|uniref:ABC transporter permease n=1 Tax=Microvirga tunisiensis TaxID=2108360 RepID=A0A5N7MCT7_9HYPH|nr:methionine ABC transporter permease [Microvirga tunisiensis]MPR05713.1 ABC transporter permease [Microvirga tunisiensis]MPR23914.1 ABC transporter permease [Microvirga tunisiensis]
MPTNFLPMFWDAFLESLIMVGTAGLVAFAAGIPLAVVLVTTSIGGIYEMPRLNRVLGSVINGFRSTPFIILLVALIPFTRLIVGTSIGLWAAVVPLSIAATPFFARIAEVSLREVDHGLVEAAQAMGASRWQIIVHVLLPEALPGIIRGFTITLVSMIGSSAMAGAVGAGGLGDLAMRYGYQRFDTTVMVSVIAVLIVIVTVVQSTGDLIASRFDRR